MMRSTKQILNDAIQILSILLVNEAKQAEGTEKKHHILSDALNSIAPGLPDLSKIATTASIEPTIA